ncbi:hypothetical protein PsYK624_066660 [Phanerochaete sordida]|uniref:DUF6535 domain-containing protein n=1 Tax=Phanerochaete sordida TaxID=48140 RepID=A0A9P3G968_9APHY|nr:hypothetical protein PsYK624_066660 [Phanerochaete sordida]
MSQAQATEQPASRPTGGSSNVRYVEVAPSTGWHTMAKAVREADEDKIRDCKEDIDTLLVFAGLYSAVLSAFNIESYTALQPNPNDQMIYLLERIAVQTQSYTISSGVLNSTIPSPPPLPTFAAPLWALRVNGLWFASLIVSLATASLSMLVKQWLREYLAFDYTAPRERVRALQYRRPGLKKWKVFEIAAVLPMLLQLSLGLFFVGLCFFTANVDKRMGLTSVPLVSEWAFFLASTTLAPLFSPRCPYKMPLFNSLMRLTRTKITMNLRRAFVVTLGHIDKFFPSSKPSQLHSEVDEEDKLVNSDADDIDILLSTDTIMADDNILLAMWNTLKGRSAPARLLAFIMELIIACVGSEGEYLRPIRLRSIPDLSMLSRKAWDAFMEMLVDLIDIHHSGGPLLVFSPDWLHKATLLLFSSSPYPLPSSANDHLRNLVATYYKDQEPDNAIRSIASWISPRAGEKPFTPRPLIQRLRFLYVDVPPETPILTTWTMSFMYAGLLSTYSPRFHTPATESLSQFFFKNPDIFKQPEALAILDEIWALLDLVLKSDYRTVDRSELLYLGLEYADQMGSRNFAVSSLAATWASSPARYKALYPLARKHHSRGEAPDVHTRMLKLGLDAFCESASA